MNVLVYGIGSKALKFTPAIAMHFTIVGYVDSKAKYASFLSKKVYSPNSLKGLHFDKIIICSSFTEEIVFHLESLNITNFVNVDSMEEIKSLVSEMDKHKEAIESHKINKMISASLSSRHIANARLLESRQILLSHLPQNSVGAEIGVFRGDFTADILDVVNPTKLHLVDIWATERFGDSEYNHVCSRFEAQLASGICEIHRKLSTQCATDFPEKYFDWVYIDTDHSYETTLSELNIYSQKVKSDGLILGHDYCLGNWVSGYKYGVIEALHKFCVDCNYEIVFLTMDKPQSFAIRKLDN